MVEHHHGARHCQGDAGDEERGAAGAQRRATAGKQYDAADQQPGADHHSERDPERLQEPHRREGEDEDGGEWMPPARPDPEGEIEEDPRPAGQREEREDQAHERRIDGERVRDAAADAGDDAVVLAALEREDGDLRHAARTISR